MSQEVNFVLLEQAYDERKLCSRPEICAICKGRHCCQNCGCSYSPEDFYVFKNHFSKEMRVRYLISFLKRGYTSIDHRHLNGGAIGVNFTPELLYNSLDLSDLILVKKEKILNGDGVLYLRTRNVREGLIDIAHIDDEYGGCCLWSEEKGCRLTYQKRPKGGRLLKPEANMICRALYTEEQSAMDWFPYQDVLLEVYKYFGGKVE